MRNRLACIVRAKCNPCGGKRASKRWRRVERESGGDGAAVVPGQCPFISRFVECQNTSFIYRRLAFFQDATSSADEKRVYYAIRLEVTRAKGGSPLSMNPMREGGPAAVCTREHKADFQWFTSSHQTRRADRRENAFGRRFPFIRAVFMPGPIFIHAQPRAWGERRVSRWNREHSAPKHSLATDECISVEFDKVESSRDQWFFNISRLNCLASTNHFILFIFPLQQFFFITLRYLIKESLTVQ